MKSCLNPFWKCEECNAMFKIKSMAHHRGYEYPRKIQHCPACYSGKIKESNYSKFNDIDHTLWISVTKGGIKFSIKFPR